MPSTSVPPPAIDALPRQSSRDPDTWLLVLALVVLVASSIQLLIFPFGRSISAHALVGRAIVGGLLPVRDAWTPDAPGIGLLHAAIQVTLGHSMMAFRTVETICVVAVVLATARITKEWLGLERVGVIGGALFAFTYVQLEIEYTGQPQFFASVLLMLALAICARETSPRSRRAVACCLGFMLGAVTLLVPSFALVALGFPRLFTRRIGESPPTPRSAWVQRSCMLVGFTIPLTLLLAWVTTAGAGSIVVRDYLHPLVRVWTSTSVITLCTRAFHLACSAALNQSALITAGLLSAFALGTIHEHERAGMQHLVGVALLVVFALALQDMQTPGALSALLPITSTLAGVGLYKTWRRVMRFGTAGWVAFVTTALMLAQMRGPVQYPPGNFVRRSKTRLLYLAALAPYHSREMLESELYSSSDYNLSSSRRIAASLRARGVTNRSVWVTSDEPQLIWLLDAMPQYRFLAPVPRNWATATPALNQRAVVEAKALKPEFIIIPNGPSESLPSVGSAAQWTNEYKLVDVVDNWKTYKRNVQRRNPLDESEFCDPNQN